MKLKLDENLPEALIAVLAALGHKVDNVRLEGLAGQDDATVWRAAQERGRSLITRIWISRTSGSLPQAPTTGSCWCSFIIRGACAHSILD